VVPTKKKHDKALKPIVSPANSSETAEKSSLRPKASESNATPTKSLTKEPDANNGGPTTESSNPINSTAAKSTVGDEADKFLLSSMEKLGLHDNDDTEFTKKPSDANKLDEKNVDVDSGTASNTAKEDDTTDEDGKEEDTLGVEVKFAHKSVFVSNPEPFYQTKLVTAPERTTSVKDEWKHLRDPHVGGVLSLHKMLQHRQGIIVKYTDAEHAVRFEAVVTKSNVIHKVVKGDAGSKKCFMWDALNLRHGVGGTRVNGRDEGLRRYCFWFPENHHLAVFLYHLFGRSNELLDEFYSKKGHFYLCKKTLPPHDQEVNEDGMDTDRDSVQIDEVVKYDEDGWFDDDPDFDPQDMSQRC
jgi:hypothetical protein